MKECKRIGFLLAGARAGRATRFWAVDERNESPALQKTFVLAGNSLRTDSNCEIVFAEDYSYCERAVCFISAGSVEIVDQGASRFLQPLPTLLLYFPIQNNPDSRILTPL